MRAISFLAFASFTTLMPALVVAWTMGAMAPFWFLAGDAYLYLGIGQASQGPAMSFDGLRPTNGFHPAWQVWVRLATAMTGDPLGAMTLVAWSAITCTLGGVLALGAAIQRFTGSWLLALLTVPGVYYLTIGQSLHNLPVWGFFDGMEAGLAFLISGLLLWLVARRTTHPLTLGLVIAALVLTRLDEIFVPAGIALCVTFWPGRPFARRITDAALLVAPTAIAVALYVGWSVWTTGMLAPVSGAAKGEGALLQNAWVTLATFFAPLIDLRAALTSYTADRAGLLGGAFRVVELVIPALFAAGFLFAILKRYRGQTWAPLMAGICIGILLKALYNFVNVNYWHQATWYYALSMAMMSAGAAILLAPVARRLQSRGTAALAALVLGGMSLLHASLWSATLTTDALRPAQRDFWLARAQTEAAIRRQEPNPRVMEFGDGMINFTFDFPVRHGFVFAGDAQSLDALHHGRLLRDSYTDGFTLLSSYEYLRVPDGAEDWDSDTIRRYLETSFLDERVKPELALFDFEMLTVARPWGVPFIRLIPRDSAQP
ncbi:hypothetical protein [Pararhodobacter zhoushanensis]|uniref:Glycosyltransferase RgtA/B/C/D-like domain-containing protein n=1 Tax=Pararhodobacter zhoushanensis TaxID=2479545 RepID=A0ABT3GZZ6_9RHOB|nr:hypothetical protein [Pararhodobacter zhoushanensis]MCW1933114.1 hypothetical protein [Pararhodobacter zhoushanensis]